MVGEGDVGQRLDTQTTAVLCSSPQHRQGLQQLCALPITVWVKVRLQPCPGRTPASPHTANLSGQGSAALYVGVSVSGEEP